VTGSRRKLIDAAVEVLRTRGIAGTSAGAIATEAGLNQALVFDHFGTVDGLVEAACRESTAERVKVYHDRFLAVTSLRGLLSLARQLNVAERDAGNVAVLAQVLAAAQQDPGLASAARDSLRLWVAEIEAVLRRVLADSPVSELASPADLAPAVAAAFIGIELYEGVDPEATGRALNALETLSVLAEVLDDLGPVARYALRSHLRRSGPRRYASPS
jgi:AcrR family transcriptional regulator